MSSGSKGFARFIAWSHALLEETWWYNWER